ncbi:MAG: hypothetical protein XU15_C0011G0165 [candidate division NC10 bacterium CSP1-5]|nr:MAG: hypothetical protein XU15_C0011G0021 [candidate division NC10 bacterium CSP1-5]KRT69483.1 MAG: hypothetical protein XU15_C0011G0165 [candidate division NC10 bacterium CSP1-5]
MIIKRQSGWRKFLTLVYWRIQIAALLGCGRPLEILETFTFQEQEPSLEEDDYSQYGLSGEPEHSTDQGAFCWCGPRVQGDVIIHRDLPRIIREAIEQQAKGLRHEPQNYPSNL